MDLFTIVPVIIGIGFVVVIGVVITQAGKGLAEWSHNNSLPVASVPARIVTKRTETSGSGSSSGGSVSTSYYATFELEAGERMEFWISGAQYGMLAEGDAGTLTHQGTRYHGFAREAKRG